MTHLTSLMSSPPDRENLVFEIWLGTDQLAEVSHEPGRQVEIEIYPPAEGGKWSFELEEFMSLLSQAVKNLQQL
jgi:phage pi2 protein 07